MGELFELRFHSEVIKWIEQIEEDSPQDYIHVMAALQRLREVGPGLRRPTVGTVEGSDHRNMRELRPRSGSRSSIRLLFVFDPERRAVVLVAGNKAQDRQWNAWYRWAIKEADSRYREYLVSIADEEGE